MTKGFKRYVCHKVVEAVQIMDMTEISNGAILDFDGGVEFFVDSAFMEKHEPKLDEYIVIYKDGYMSCSPGHAFEEGYTEDDGAVPDE